MQNAGMKCITSMCSESYLYLVDFVPSYCSTIYVSVSPPSGQIYVQCTYIVRTLYVQARTYRFGTDNIRNESFLDVRVRTYNVRT